MSNQGQRNTWSCIDALRQQAFPVTLLSFSDSTLRAVFSVCRHATGTHWEARAMAGDLMAATFNGPSNRRRTISNITLAAALDSGWFNVNHSWVGFLRNSFHKGCSLLSTDGCDRRDTQDPNELYTCSMDGDRRCTMSEFTGVCTKGGFTTPCMTVRLGPCTSAHGAFAGSLQCVKLRNETFDVQQSARPYVSLFYSAMCTKFPLLIR